MTDPASAPAPDLSPGALKGALKCFRKRIKAIRLDKESGKIGGPLSSGKSSGIVGITPPSQYPREVWDALVKEGRLTYEGNGTYGLAGE